jgi:uncharacterized protein (DUF1778 family)
MKNTRSERAYLIRFDSELYGLLKKVADARGESVSTFVRRAVLRELARLSYLDEERKKALEL